MKQNKRIFYDYREIHRDYMSIKKFYQEDVKKYKLMNTYVDETTAGV